MTWRYTGLIYKGKGYPSLHYGEDENNLIKSPEGQWGRISFVDEHGNRAHLEFTDMTLNEFIARIMKGDNKMLANHLINNQV